MTYQDSEFPTIGQCPLPLPPFLLVHKGNSKFEILHVKIFILKQKTNQTPPGAIEKISVCLFRKKPSHVLLGNEITMRKCKTNANQMDLDLLTYIPAYSGIFRHIQAHSSITSHIQELFTHIQVYSEHCVTLQYSEPEAYSEFQSNFIEIALRHGCSHVNLLHIFRTSFPRNTSG